MSDMKCPFCQQELFVSSLRTGDEDHQMWSCFHCELSACRKIWQELIRTRKALDVALCSLQDIAESDGDFITGSTTTFDAQEYAEMMLDKIRWNEKDVK